MKIIVPMAGVGKRLRPFTLTTPKPLLKIASKSIVRRLVEKIISVSSEKVTEVGFIIGDFPESVVSDLNDIGKQLDFKVNIFVQDEALGTAHALSFARKMMFGNVIVAYADTLFDASFKIGGESDVLIWTKKVDNPEDYGVVIKDDSSLITAFYEKPKEFVSDEAIIGIYYFKDAKLLLNKVDYLMANKLLSNNEYQLTDALQLMLDGGLVFRSQTVDIWLDCGNKDILIKTAGYVIKHFGVQSNINAVINNSVIVEPVYLGSNVVLNNCVLGPNVSVEDNSSLSNVVAKNSIISSNSELSNIVFENSMFGNYSNFTQSVKILDIGDYDKINI